MKAEGEEDEDYLDTDDDDDGEEDDEDEDEEEGSSSNRPSFQERQKSRQRRKLLLEKQQQGAILRKRAQKIANKRMAKFEKFFEQSEFKNQQEVELNALGFLIDEMQVMVGTAGLTEKSFEDGRRFFEGNGKAKKLMRELGRKNKQRWGASDYIQAFKIEKNTRVGYEIRERDPKKLESLFKKKIFPELLRRKAYSGFRRSKRKEAGKRLQEDLGIEPAAVVDDMFAMRSSTTTQQNPEELKQVKEDLPVQKGKSSLGGSWIRKSLLHRRKQLRTLQVENTSDVRFSLQSEVLFAFQQMSQSKFLLNQFIQILTAVGKRPVVNQHGIVGGGMGESLEDETDEFGYSKNAQTAVGPRTHLTLEMFYDNPALGLGCANEKQQKLPSSSAARSLFSGSVLVNNTDDDDDFFAADAWEPEASTSNSSSSQYYYPKTYKRKAGCLFFSKGFVGWRNSLGDRRSIELNRVVSHLPGIDEYLEIFHEFMRVLQSFGVIGPAVLLDCKEVRDQELGLGAGKTPYRHTNRGLAYLQHKSMDGCQRGFANVGKVVDFGALQSVLTEENPETAITEAAIITQVLERKVFKFNAERGDIDVTGRFVHASNSSNTAGSRVKRTGSQWKYSGATVNSIYQDLDRRRAKGRYLQAKGTNLARMNKDSPVKGDGVHPLIVYPEELFRIAVQERSREAWQRKQERIQGVVARVMRVVENSPSRLLPNRLLPKFHQDDSEPDEALLSENQAEYVENLRAAVASSSFRLLGASASQNTGIESSLHQENVIIPHQTVRIDNRIDSVIKGNLEGSIPVNSLIAQIAIQNALLFWDSDDPARADEAGDAFTTTTKFMGSKKNPPYKSGIISDDSNTAKSVNNVNPLLDNLNLEAARNNQKVASRLFQEGLSTTLSGLTRKAKVPRSSRAYKNLVSIQQHFQLFLLCSWVWAQLVTNIHGQELAAVNSSRKEFLGTPFENETFPGSNSGSGSRQYPLAAGNFLQGWRRRFFKEQTQSSLLEFYQQKQEEEFYHNQIQTLEKLATIQRHAVAHFLITKWLPKILPKIKSFLLDFRGKEFLQHEFFEGIEKVLHKLTKEAVDEETSVEDFLRGGVELPWSTMSESSSVQNGSGTATGGGPHFLSFPESFDEDFLLTSSWDYSISKKKKGTNGNLLQEQGQNRPQTVLLQEFFENKVKIALFQALSLLQKPLSRLIGGVLENSKKLVLPNGREAMKKVKVLAVSSMLRNYGADAMGNVYFADQLQLSECKTVCENLNSLSQNDLKPVKVKANRIVEGEKVSDIQQTEISRSNNFVVKTLLKEVNKDFPARNLLKTKPATNLWDLNASAAQPDFKPDAPLFLLRCQTDEDCANLNRQCTTLCNKAGNSAANPFRLTQNDMRTGRYLENAYEETFHETVTGFGRGDDPTESILAGSVVGGLRTPEEKGARGGVFVNNKKTLKRGKNSGGQKQKYLPTASALSKHQWVKSDVSYSWPLAKILRATEDLWKRRKEGLERGHLELERGRIIARSASGAGDGEISALAVERMMESVQDSSPSFSPSSLQDRAMLLFALQEQLQGRLYLDRDDLYRLRHPGVAEAFQKELQNVVNDVKVTYMGSSGEFPAAFASKHFDSSDENSIENQLRQTPLFGILQEFTPERFHDAIEQAFWAGMEGGACGFNKSSTGSSSRSSSPGSIPTSSSSGNDSTCVVVLTAKDLFSQGHNTVSAQFDEISDSGDEGDLPGRNDLLNTRSKKNPTEVFTGREIVSQHWGSAMWLSVMGITSLGVTAGRAGQVLAEVVPEASAGKSGVSREEASATEAKNLYENPHIQHALERLFHGLVRVISALRIGYGFSLFRFLSGAQEISSSSAQVSGSSFDQVAASGDEASVLLEGQQRRSGADIDSNSESRYLALRRDLEEGARLREYVIGNVPATNNNANSNVPLNQQLKKELFLEAFVTGSLAYRYKLSDFHGVAKDQRGFKQRELKEKWLLNMFHTFISHLRRVSDVQAVLAYNERRAGKNDEVTKTLARLKEGSAVVVSQSQVKQGFSIGGDFYQPKQQVMIREVPERGFRQVKEGEQQMGKNLGENESSRSLWRRNESSRILPKAKLLAEYNLDFAEVVDPRGHVLPNGSYLVKVEKLYLQRRGGSSYSLKASPPRMLRAFSGQSRDGPLKKAHSNPLRKDHSRSSGSQQSSSSSDQSAKFMSPLEEVKQELEASDDDQGLSDHRASDEEAASDSERALGSFKSVVEEPSLEGKNGDRENHVDDSESDHVLLEVPRFYLLGPGDVVGLWDAGIDNSQPIIARIEEVEELRFSSSNMKSFSSSNMKSFSSSSVKLAALAVTVIHSSSDRQLENLLELTRRRLENEIGEPISHSDEPGTLHALPHQVFRLPSKISFPTPGEASDGFGGANNYSGYADYGFTKSLSNEDGSADDRLKFELFRKKSLTSLQNVLKTGALANKPRIAIGQRNIGQKDGRDWRQKEAVTANRIHNELRDKKILRPMQARFKSDYEYGFFEDKKSRLDGLEDRIEEAVTRVAPELKRRSSKFAHYVTKQLLPVVQDYMQDDDTDRELDEAVQGALEAVKQNIGSIALEEFLKIKEMTAVSEKIDKSVSYSNLPVEKKRNMTLYIRDMIGIDDFFKFENPRRTPDPFAQTQQ